MSTEMPFELTESAAKQVHVVKTRDGKPDASLRIQVVGGGCSGMSYKLSFDESPATENDLSFKSQGVEMLIDQKSLLFVKGTILDFSDGLNGQGFVFTNPNAKTTCGCGSSFSA